MHNSTPHSSTGQSPHFLLFGFEPSLLGWQAYRRCQATGPLLREARLKTVYQQQLVEEAHDLSQNNNIKVGEHYLGENQNDFKNVADYNAPKYCSSWSFPAKALVCIRWGIHESPHQVPLTPQYSGRGPIFSVEIESGVARNISTTEGYLLIAYSAVQLQRLGHHFLIALIRR